MCTAAVTQAEASWQGGGRARPRTSLGKGLYFLKHTARPEVCWEGRRQRSDAAWDEGQRRAAPFAAWLAGPFLDRLVVLP